MGEQNGGKGAVHAMENISIDEFEKKFRNVFTRVADDQEPASVIMDEGREVILVDGAEYRSVMETFYLLRSPANAERLRRVIQQHRKVKRGWSMLQLTWTDTGLEDLAFYLEKQFAVFRLHRNHKS